MAPKWTTVAFLAAAVLIPAPLLFPSFCFHIIMLLDFFTPFVAFDSPIVQNYHKFLVERLPDLAEREPVIITDLSTLTRESLAEASKGYTIPVVVRGIIKDIPALEKWKDADWWKENYGNESVLCKYVEKLGDAPECTVGEALGDKEGNGRLYISGESRIFIRRPELKQMVDSDAVNSIAPGSPVFTQIFMGYNGMGSDMHGAVGCNLFRQITGVKKWWLVPQSQSPLVFPSLNPNGFSAHTKTMIGKGNETASPWLKKIERYTVTLYPGDMLLNPPWFWHGIRNDGSDPNELVIGVPTRYKIAYSLPALKNNWLLTLVALGSISKTYGLEKFLGDPSNLQNGIERARKARAAQVNVNQEPELTEEQEKMERQM